MLFDDLECWDDVIISIWCGMREIPRGIKVFMQCECCVVCSGSIVMYVINTHYIYIKLVMMW